MKKVLAKALALLVLGLLVLAAVLALNLSDSMQSYASSSPLESPLSTPEVITKTVYFTDTVAVTAVVYVTITQVVVVPVVHIERVIEAAQPVFIDPICGMQQARMEIPTSLRVQYFKSGIVEPGSTVSIMARLAPGINGRLDGETQWQHTFPIPEGCPTAAGKQQDLYLPQLANN